ncbi:MAG: tRNA glutamyl-Q(34) synthetase GluQRS [Bacteroidota bacterium]
MASVRGRYAPSPTGPIHLGNARTALAAWLSVRSKGGVFVWRLEDLDPPRVVPGMAEAAQRDLAWLGLDWDEGPELGGRHAPYVQSERSAWYEDALTRLAASGRLFPCRYSRKDLQAMASAPHGHRGLPPYPASLRPTTLAPDWLAAYRAQSRPNAALRFTVRDEVTVFRDGVQGEQRENVSESVGDVVLKRRDGLYAYQLAVVVDDVAMGITEVVRGADLLASTARQIQLTQALGASVPQFTHVPLVRNAEGEKLSKRDGALALAALRERGIRPEQVVGYLAYTLGLWPAPTAAHPRDLIGAFTLRTIPPSDWVLDADVEANLRAVR